MMSDMERVYIPPISDYVLVVRCRDCVYGRVTQAMSGRDMIDCCNGESVSCTTGWLLPLDWYCPDGVRRDSGE